MAGEVGEEAHAYYGNHADRERHRGAAADRPG
jgi:hypothetical protein